MRSESDERVSGLAYGGKSVNSYQAGNTGRSLKLEKDYDAVDIWSKLTAESDILSNPLAKEFCDQIVGSKLETTEPLVGFRMRRPPKNGMFPSVEFMGPPTKVEYFRDARYSNRTHPALYLSDSEQGCWQEMQNACDSLVPYIIKAHIQIDDLDIADFRVAKNWSELVSSVFLRAEECDIPERGGVKGDYNFSQAIANLVSKKFDGMIVPGVRSIDSQPYNNIVLFKHLHRWSNWAIKSSIKQFHPIASSETDNL